MPSTEYNTAAIAVTKGEVWAGLAIPAAGAMLALDASGRPDAVANPLRRLLGLTREGAEFMVKPNFEKYYADEFSSAIKTDIGDTEAAISGEFLQVLDIELMSLLTPGVSTLDTAAGYEKISLGKSAVVYSSVALIFPLEADPAKFGVFHLYKAINNEGIQIGIGRKKLSGTPVTFTGLDIPGRVPTDSLGSYWKQI